jgi:hypothetical protein
MQFTGITDHDYCKKFTGFLNAIYRSGLFRAVDLIQKRSPHNNYKDNCFASFMIIVKFLQVF